MPDRTHPKSKPDNYSDEPFYESMPAAYDQYAGLADADAEDADDELLTAQRPPLEADNTSYGRFTAIITLVLVALVAAILAVLFLRGLDAIKSTVPSTQSNSSGSLEL